MAKQLAMSFLKFPFAMVHTLLQGWVEYMKSPEHETEKARAQRLDTGDAKAVTEKQHQQELKMKVHSLRHQIRQIKALSAKTTYSDMTWHQKQQHERWQSGEMHLELEMLTRQHGYGTLPFNKGTLGATRFTDTIKLKR